ncbi:acyl-CoA Delta-9 desaturase-like [Anticarsia gemmatalis]|uniref:acyl-CoA Delta-9 desaturase-like n=1 Tax=Anticarsia gemmatalis TaxID=129554 RepID=UPI003F75F842
MTCYDYNGLSTENGPEPKAERKWHLVWHNVVFFTIMHIGSIYAIYLLFTDAKWLTLFFAYILYVCSTVGVTAGAHRLWSHKAYKAKLPMKIILLIFYTIAYQGSVHQWVRDHRVHHKYVDTDADPHNATRGFFFSHIGWLLLKKHPDILAKGKDIYLKDVQTDKLLRFQQKYYFPLVVVLCFVFPTYVPLLWGENLWTAFYIAAVLRHTFTLHMTFLINSAAHMWGTKPYDQHILPTETKAVSLVACGEGFHNYHHTFPWDYRAAELGDYTLNISLFFIDLMAKIGWAYDLKTVSEEQVEKRVKKTGDGTHAVWGDEKSDSIDYL